MVNNTLMLHALTQAPLHMGGFTLMKRPGPRGRTQRTDEHAIMVTTSGAFCVCVCAYAFTCVLVLEGMHTAHG